MKYKLLGRSGLRVSELCLGTMTFGNDWGWGADRDESKRIYDVFLDAGGNFIDTANKYTNGTSERYVGEFVASERERIVLATKYTLSTREGDPNSSGNHRKNLVQALDASLKRLNTDYIDLYWLHAWDFTTPVDEVMRALDDQVRAGKILYVGISDTPAWVVSQANTLADLRGWSPFIGLQVEYSLIQREVERELIPMARTLDLGVTAWAPLGGGALTGKYLEEHDQGGRLSADHPRLSDRYVEIARSVKAVADELGASSAQVALAWLRQRPGGVTVPIVGARTSQQLGDSLGCLEVELGDGQLARLDKVSAVPLGFPHEFLQSKAITNIVYSGTYDDLQDHRGRVPRRKPAPPG